MIELIDFFRDAQPGQPVRAVPGAGLRVPIWILGSSLFGAQVAAGARACRFRSRRISRRQLLHEAIAVYRERFTPSEHLADAVRDARREHRRRRYRRRGAVPRLVRPAVVREPARRAGRSRCRRRRRSGSAIRPTRPIPPTRRACRSSARRRRSRPQIDEFVEQHQGRRTDRRCRTSTITRRGCAPTSSPQPVEFSAMNCPRCGQADAAAHARRPPRSRDRDRSLRAVPVALVRRAREPAAHARRHARDVPRHRRARVARPSSRDGELAKCPRCKAQLRRTQDMQRSTRFEYFRCPNDHGRLIDVLRLPEGEGLHQAADAAADRRAAQERPDHQLLELRRADRSGEGAPTARTAARRCRCSTCSRPSGWSRSCVTPTRTDKTSIPRCRWRWRGRARETERAFAGPPGHDAVGRRRARSLGLVGAGLSRADPAAQDATS